MVKYRPDIFVSCTPPELELAIYECNDKNPPRSKNETGNSYLLNLGSANHRDLVTKITAVNIDTVFIQSEARLQCLDEEGKYYQIKLEVNVTFSAKMCVDILFEGKLLKSLSLSYL